jgi:tetratricopeptide (TPR) repeat protein
MSLLFSCSTVKSIKIETYNPAAITFPPEVKTLMIINNSAQQPDGIGHRYIRGNKEDSVISVSADSTAYDFCLWLGKNIAESPVFYDVRICEDTLRRDSVFYAKRPFSAGEVKELCESYGVDGLISLDNMFFITKVFDTGLGDWPAGSFINIQIMGELRALWPDQKEIYTFPFSDSLEWYWSDQVYAEDFVEMATKPNVKDAMRYLSGDVGEKMYINFVPYWSFENRWYYTSVSSEWKRGTVYADAGKWEEAARIWELLFPKIGKWNSKARLLSNLALCNEMTGNFDKAIDYAEKSVQLFKENAGEDSEYTKLQDKYVEALKKRAKNDVVLSRQLHEAIETNAKKGVSKVGFPSLRTE